MRPPRAVLIDLSGVLYVGSKPLPGTQAALARLREAGLALRFVTNTTRRTSEKIAADLAAMGLAIEAGEIETAGSAARDYVRRHGLHPHLLIHPGLAAAFADLAEYEGAPDSVLVGDAAEGFTYATLDRCFQVLAEDPGRPLVAMAMNRYFHTGDGLHLDMGPFVAALEYATQRRAIVTGKPAPAFFQAALGALDCQPAEAVMIGDDLEADIEGAAAVGIRAMLVRTGKFQPDDEARARAQDFAVVDDFAAAVAALLGERDGAC